MIPPADKYTPWPKSAKLDFIVLTSFLSSFFWLLLMSDLFMAFMASILASITLASSDSTFLVFSFKIVLGSAFEVVGVKLNNINKVRKYMVYFFISVVLIPLLAGQV